MKKFNLISALFLAALLVFSFSSVKAQADASDVPNQENADNRRPNLLAELALTQDQIRQIRLINTENKPSLRAAQQHLRAANQNLDRAIYADNLDEAGIQSLIKEVQSAQIEVIKLRAATELAVRRILTQEQLVKFRDLRQQFIEKIEKRPKQLQNRSLNFSNRRLNNRQRSIVSPD
ncbi:MAG: periplasmic heavy metal sensor [Acidobacteriota bacterium]|nr:periplasmic heavy metal sensor [Acidobacteriota bacterium]